MTVLIQIGELTKKYHRGNRAVTVLRTLNLEVHQESIIGLMESSGSDKSTLLNLID